MVFCSRFVGEETARTAPDPPDAGGEASSARLVDDPQDWQKRVSPAKAAPHDAQKLIFPSSELLGVRLQAGMCLQPTESANQLCANCGLTVNSFFFMELGWSINSFQSAFRAKLDPHPPPVA